MRSKSLFAASAALAALLAPAAARAQARPEGAAAPNPELLAAVAAKRKTDPEAWHLLGIEHNRAGDIAAARAAFREALRLRPGFANARAGLAYTFFAEGNFDEAERQALEAANVGAPTSRDQTALNVYAAIHLERFRDRCVRARAEAEAALAAPGADPRWHLLKAQALLGLTVGQQRIGPDLSPPPPATDAERAANAAANRALLAEAATHLAQYLSLRPDAPDRKALREQLEAVRHHAGLAASAEPAFSASDVTKKAVIRSKPEPSYTEAARRRNVHGIVRLRVVLAADGRVRHLVVVKPLSEGLAERALAAARKIKFTPASKDGRNVSQLVSLEYNFHIY